MPPIRLRFVQSATDHRTLPELDAEVAFAGRSNVGKSSLINALANRKHLAHTSKTPGRTQLLNMYVLEEEPTLGIVDLPGYGYAAGASKRIRRGWQQMIETYLIERTSLTMVVVLVDGLVGPTDLDLTMLAWLGSHAIPHAVVATKHDRVKSSLRQRRRQELARRCHLDPGDVIWVSAATGTNLDLLRRAVLAWLELP